MGSITTLSYPSWESDQALENLMHVLNQGDAPETRLVGGVVRDALLDRLITDIDLATILKPEEVQQRLKSAGIVSKPLGIEHGTVLAIIEGRALQITTLRQDVETFGRKARVGFVEDWTEDAKRRDFTMNALYADFDGTIYDPLGTGIEGAKSQRIRFIGDPDERLAEDALRFLRFFRFCATHGRGEVDSAGLEACKRHVSELEILSGERLWQEVKRLIIAPKALDVLEVMNREELLAPVLGCTIEKEKLAQFEALVALEEKLEVELCSIRRLACLVDSKGADFVSARWKLSKQESLMLKALVQWKDHDTWTTVGRFKALYYEGYEKALGFTLLSGAALKKSPQEVQTALKEIETLKKSAPKFPLKGADLLEAGISPGPEMGKALKRTERWWVEMLGQPSKEECLRYLKSYTNND
ncbi:MAG: CCA tRNA nucleotidyltransferase [bacterium]|nr:CCA tRNA nucleotidyltransferase [bacterium]